MNETDPVQIKALVSERIDIESILWDYEPVMLIKPIEVDSVLSIAYIDSIQYKQHEGMSTFNNMPA